MGIALGHGRRLVTEQPLHLVQIHPSLRESRGKGVPQIMETEIRDLGFLQCRIKCPRQVSGINPCPTGSCKHKGVFRADGCLAA